MTAIVLYKTLLFFTPALFHDFLVDGIASGPPFLQWRRQSLFLRHANGPVKGHPTHDPRVRERSPATSHLPDALISALPVVLQPLEQAQDVVPASVVHAAFAHILVNPIEEFTGDIKLQLRVGAIANAHRATMTVAIQVIQGDLGHVMSTVNGVHRLYRAILFQLSSSRLQPIRKRLCLLVETEREQTVNG